MNDNDVVEEIPVTIVGAAFLAAIAAIEEMDAAGFERVYAHLCAKGSSFYDLYDALTAAEEEEVDYEAAFKALVMNETKTLLAFMATNPEPPRDPKTTLGEMVRAQPTQSDARE